MFECTLPPVADDFAPAIPTPIAWAFAFALDDALIGWLTLSSFANTDNEIVDNTAKTNNWVFRIIPF